MFTISGMGFKNSGLYYEGYGTAIVAYGEAGKVLIHASKLKVPEIPCQKAL